MQRALIAIGIVLLILGLLWPWLGKLPLGRLPGDIRIEKDGFVFYFPIVTGIVISVVVSLIAWWLRK
jgi:hypothetical protein